MSMRLSDLVAYRAERLFNGAVDISWVLRDPDKAKKAAASYVFHGPSYHGVSQHEVGVEHGHTLVDTASFATQVVRRCNGNDDKPFTLAIAGYGTGKSHLATTLAVLLSEPCSERAAQILEGIESLEEGLSVGLSQELAQLASPAMVVAINGMGDFDLAAEVTRQVMYRLDEAGLDSRPIQALRPRFSMATSLINRLNEEEAESLLAATGLPSIQQVTERLRLQDESIYVIVHGYLSSLGLPLHAIGDETVKDVIETVCREYVGNRQAFSRLVLLFDEFGRYAEFATIRSQVAGSGVLQQLFEGVQAQSDKTTFVGLIQFDLNTYVQRLGSEYRNDLLRVSTRYQSAEKAYLSINLETLLATLLEKKHRSELERWYSDPGQLDVSAGMMASLHRWFPNSRNHGLWSDVDRFHRVVRRGCWPLSPYATWLLYHLAAAGQHLQQRSALSLLEQSFGRYSSMDVSDYGWELPAVGMWSPELETELLTSEEGGSRGAIAHAYANAMARSGQHLTATELDILRAIVLASKMGNVADSPGDAIEAIASLAGHEVARAADALQSLEDERNVITWDDRFSQFDIICESVSRPQFLAHIRRRVADKYDQRARSQLFVRRAREWCSGVLSDRQCNFAELHNITTKEWSFSASVANEVELPRVLDSATRAWKSAIAVDSPKGTIVYCYLDAESDVGRTKLQAAALLRNMAKSEEAKAIPVVIVLLHDSDGKIGQCFAELSVLEEDLSEEDKAKFGNLVGTHRQKCLDQMTALLEDAMKERHYVWCMAREWDEKRIGTVCDDVFEVTYPRALPFPFDGFGTARGNAADTCYRLTLALWRGQLTYNEVQALPIRDKNRATEVLNNCWGVFLRNGDISQRVQDGNARAVCNAWDAALRERGGVVVLADLVNIACRPPFGASIASAGLLLGAFLSARHKLLCVEDRDGDRELAELNADDLCRGKFLDLERLELLALTPKQADEASEWDALLDAWEASLESSYAEVIEHARQAGALRLRTPVPRGHAYRLSLLEGRAKEAQGRLAQRDARLEEAYSRIEASERREDLRNLTFGAIKLKEIADQMQADAMYGGQDIERHRHEVERVCQRVIQLLPAWLARQMPRGRTAVDAAEFDRYMEQSVTNVRRLGLGDLEAEIGQHRAKALAEINALAEAQSLSEAVESWLREHVPSRGMTVSDIRNCRDVANGYLKDVVRCQRRVRLPCLEGAIRHLAGYISQTKDNEKGLLDKAKALLNRPINVSAIDEMADELVDLLRAFEGCEADAADFRLLHRGMVFYRSARSQLSDHGQTVEGVEKLYESLQARACAELGDDLPAWGVDEVMPELLKEALEHRLALGSAWLEAIGSQVARIAELEIGAAIALHDQCLSPPAYLGGAQRGVANSLRVKVEEHLSALKVEWLVEKYLELDEPSRTAFLQAINGLGWSR